MFKLSATALILFVQTIYSFASVPLTWMNESTRNDKIKSVQVGERTYIDVLNLADKLNIHWKSDKRNQRIRLDFPTQSLILTSNSPFITSDENLIQIPEPLISRNNRIHAPLDYIIPVIANEYPGELYFDLKELQILASPPQYNIHGIRYIVEPQITRAIISAGKLLECRADSADGGVKLTFKGGTADKSVVSTIPKMSLIEDADIIYKKNYTIVEFAPTDGARFVNYETETDPPLYIVDFQSDDAHGLNLEELRRLNEEKKGWEFDVVVIDPGHGGKDPGAVGYSKLYEKDVTLDVGLRLRDELKKKGIKTVMTREKDVFLELWERTKIANNAGGKLFVSLHCNSFPNGQAHGVETYFLSPTKTERAMRVALRENSVIKYEESKDQYDDLTEENFILLTMAQANFVKESESFAGVVQNNLPPYIGLRDRGVDQAGFYVLIGASMPAVLVEMAFLSNKKEEKKLKDKKFRQKLAEGIAESIEKFLKDADLASQP